MDRIFNRAPINFMSVLKFDHLDKHVQRHLRNVYSTLAIGIVAAAAGAYIHVFNIFQAGVLSFIMSLGLVFGVLLTENKRENQLMRLGMFAGCGFFTGMNLGPLIDSVGIIDETILPTALLATGLIFVSFTLSALLNQSRVFLYLSGFLFTALNLLMMIGFFNIFLGSKTIMSAELFIGLAVFCLFVLFDTQLIIEKRRTGDTDFIWHALDLFLDIVAIFRRLMILLAKKSDRNNRRDD